MVDLRTIVHVLSFLGFTSCIQFYYSNGVKKTWNDAKLDCECRGMELAILDTATKYQSATDYMKTQSGNNMPNDVYTGISLDRSKSYPPYVYIYTTGIVASYLPWIAGEPNSQDTDFCLRIKRPDLLLATIGCNSLYDYLCTSDKPGKPCSGNSGTPVLTTEALQQTTESLYQNKDSTTKKPFPGTIFVSGAVIGMAVGAASACCGICLLCVFCRFCRRGKDAEEKIKPEAAKTNTVVPKTTANVAEPRVKLQYIP